MASGTGVDSDIAIGKWGSKSFAQIDASKNEIQAPTFRAFINVVKKFEKKVGSKGLSFARQVGQFDKRWPSLWQINFCGVRDSFLCSSLITEHPLQHQKVL